MQTLKDEIRDSILEVAKKTFVKKGFEKSTMRDIASGANISVGNIYRYFENKEKILDELLNEFEEDLQNYLVNLDELIFKNKENEKSNIKTYVSGLQKVLSKNDTAVYIIANMETNSKFIKFEDRLIKKCAKQLLEANNTSKNKHLNEGVAEAIACGLIYGVKNIIKRFDKQDKDTFNTAKKDLEVYIEITMHDIMLRLADVEI